KKKAETALKRVQDGEDFGEIAKRLSDGSTKGQGGFLGVYKRGELSKELEDKVFQMKRNQLTEVMETKQGYLVLQVLEHYDEGEPYVRIELGDRSGTIEARMWAQFDVVAKDISRDDFVKVNARVEIYRNRPQLALLQLRLAKPEEIDLADFLPHTKENVEKLFAQLREFAASISNPWLNKLVTGIISNPAVAAKYKRAPAAKVMHHAYLGGLIEH